jgi:hypothetical protein
MQTQADQHPVHRRGRHPHDPRDTRGAELEPPPQVFDPALQHVRCLVRTRIRPAGTILESRPALAAEPLPPLVCRRARDPHLVGDVRDRTATLDPLDQRASTKRRELRVTVHQSLPRLRVGRDTHTLPRGLSSFADQRTVNNVRGHYI